MNPYAALGALKIYVCVVTLIVAVPGLTAGRWLPVEHAAFWVMVCLGLFVLLDAVVNDLLPGDYTAPVAAEYRYLALVSMAGGHLSALHADVISGAASWESVRYALDAAAAVVVATLDLALRRQQHAKDARDTHRLPAGPA